MSKSMASGRLRGVLLLLAVLAPLAVARADVVVLKDGRRIEGSVVSETGGVVKVQTAFGELEFKQADVQTIERGKTRAQEFSERWRAAKTAEDFFQLGQWAEARKLAADTKKCMARALELDARHAGAHQWFGHVEYKGEWLTPAERDLRMQKDREAEMAAKGLVRWQDQWVTPEELAHLSKNEVLVEGKWIPFEEAQHRKGLELSGSTWLPRAEALARNDALAVAQVGKLQLAQALGPDALVCGPVAQDMLDEIVEGLAKGRAWFDPTYAAPKGLEIFRGRMAELYVFPSDEPYLATLAHFQTRSPTLPNGWAEAVKNAHGFFFIDPYPLSSARRWTRAEEDLVGHCYHHWGHLLVSSLAYDGRLLPPWYEEGLAALVEFRCHGRNAVFCRGHGEEPPVGPSTGGPSKRDPGTKAKGGTTKPPEISADFNPKDLREGAWRGALKNGLQAGNAPPFDRLSTREFTQLESADIAASMGIVEWLESKNALRAFHDELRKAAPPAPKRVLDNPYERMACYEKAFQAAVKLSTKDADQAWRAWFLNR